MWYLYMWGLVRWLLHGYGFGNGFGVSGDRFLFARGIGRILWGMVVVWGLLPIGHAVGQEDEHV